MTQPSTEADLNANENLREIRYEYSNNLANLLDHLKIFLFFSTYQAGKLGVVTVKDNVLQISFHNAEVKSKKLAMFSCVWLWLI